MSRRVAVFGASGFIGSHIAAAAHRSGFKVVAISRARQAPKHLMSKLTNVTDDTFKWYSADATKAETYAEVLADVDSVVISIGSPPVPTISEESRRKQVFANGKTNCVVLDAAATAGVSHAVLVSATMPSWAPSGYLEGKRMAFSCTENFVASDSDRTATVVKPSLVYGSRSVEVGSFQGALPLHVVFGPVAMLMRLPLMSQLLQFLTEKLPSLFEGVLLPPVSVHRIASVVVKSLGETGQRRGIHVIGVNDL